MRKLIPFLLLALVVSLTGCRLSASQPSQSVEPTLSDVQVQTQISTLLTAQPTSTEVPALAATPTPALPTLDAVVAPKATATAEEQATKPDQPTTTQDVVQAAKATATLEPTLAPVNTATSVPQGPTPTLSKDDPRAKQGNASSTDPLSDASRWTWPTGANEFTAVSFANGALNLTSLKEMTGWRLANPEGEALGNVYLEATFKTGTCAENDQYGVIARVPVLKDANQGYLFGFTCDGRYSIRLWDGTIAPKGKMTRLIDWTASKAVNAGSNQTNRLGILMSGGRLAMYANGTLLGEVTNTTFTSGYFGLFIGGMKTANFAVAVDEMAYWKNPKP